jgi:hypothetical protein
MFQPSPSALAILLTKTSCGAQRRPRTLRRWDVGVSSIRFAASAREPQLKRVYLRSRPCSRLIFATAMN